MAPAGGWRQAVQDTFVQAWRNLERFRGDAAPYTWLYRIAVNEALMRRRRTALPTSELHETVVADGEGPFAAVDVRAFLIERLRALPIDYRAAVVLRDVEGLSHEQAAAAFEISLAAATTGSTAAECSSAKRSSSGSAIPASGDAQPARSASASPPSFSPVKSGGWKNSGYGLRLRFSHAACRPARLAPSMSQG